jgi:endonuclease YncB( thermonuclease family)
VSIDLGFDLHRTTIIRLFGINAIELADPGGPEARDHLAQLAPIGATVTVVSHGYDKFGGRVDAELFTTDDTNVSRQMVIDGYAAAWTGEGPKPVPAWPIEQGGSDGADPPPAPAPGEPG